MTDDPADWLAPIRALAGKPGPRARLFFRDDDAGRDDRALELLLDLFASTATPIDVAAIPTAMNPGIARALRSRRPDGVRVHQHGYRHVNHESLGRKCEFGPSRSPLERRSDLAAGRERLAEWFGDDVDPIFTPPWNRCVDELVDDLADLGFAALSRDLTAGRATSSTSSRGSGSNGVRLAELPISVDWFGRHRGVRHSPLEFSTRVAQLLAGSAPVGIMLHHEVTGPSERDRLAEFVKVVAAHDGIECVNMVDALEGPAAAPRRVAG